MNPRNVKRPSGT